MRLPQTLRAFSCPYLFMIPRLPETLRVCAGSREAPRTSLA